MIYKAQWPLNTNWEEPCILIYPVNWKDERIGHKQYLVKATPEFKKQIFQDKYVKVYFTGRIYNDGRIMIDKFIYQKWWM